MSSPVIAPRLLGRQIDLHDANLEAGAFLTYLLHLDPNLSGLKAAGPSNRLPDFRVIEVLSSYRRRYEDRWETLVHNLNALRDHVDANEVLLAIIKDVTFIVDLLHAVLDDPNKGYKQYFSTCHPDSQALLDLLQEILELGMFQKHQSLFRKALVKLSKASGLHPECMALPKDVKMGEHAVAGGAFADVWKGKVAGQVVAIKMLRLFDPAEKSELIKLFIEEGLIWGQLDHPNILPFLGLFTMEGRLCFVSPWMENDNLVKFLKANPSTDRMVLVHDVAHGVKFLHDNKVVHGDLKAVNVMVTSQRRACLADFGLSKIVDSNAQRWTTLAATPASGGTIRWQAPELFSVGSSNSYATDTYAVGCVFYEIFSGCQPFYNVRTDAAVIIEASRGNRPARPPSDTGLTDYFWQIIKSCWAPDPTLRPSLNDIVEMMHEEGEWSCLSFSQGNYRREDIQRAARQLPLLPTLKDIIRFLELPDGKKTGDRLNISVTLADETPSNANRRVEEPPPGVSFASFIHTWTDHEVSQWLHEIKCSHYCDTFKANNIHGDVLLELEQNTLKEMGVTSVGDRIRIVNAVNSLRRKTRRTANDKNSNAYLEVPSNRSRHRSKDSVDSTSSGEVSTARRRWKDIADNLAVLILRLVETERTSSAERSPTVADATMQTLIERKAAEFGAACPNGFGWKKYSGGYVCGGGGHKLTWRQLGLADDSSELDSDQGLSPLKLDDLPIPSVSSSPLSN